MIALFPFHHPHRHDSGEKADALRAPLCENNKTQRDKETSRLGEQTGEQIFMRYKRVENDGEDADVGDVKDAPDENGDNDGDEYAGVTPVWVPWTEGECESATRWLCLQTTFWQVPQEVKHALCKTEMYLDTPLFVSPTPSLEQSWAV